MNDDNIEVIESEKGLGLFRRQKKTREFDALNNRGRKWLRDQLGLTTVITGIGILSGFSVETWLGINILALPVTMYHAKKNYSALSEDVSLGSEVSENEENEE